MSFNQSASRAAPPLLARGKNANAPAPLPERSRMSGGGSYRVQASAPAAAAASSGALSDVGAGELDSWPQRMPGLGTRGSGFYLASLNQYQVGWAVTVRVFAKSSIRPYHNERGSGQVASLTLIDASGSMKCVMFGDSVDKWFTHMKVGGVYKISGAQVRPSRVTQWEPSGDLEMQVGNDTVIEEAPDDGSVPHHSLKMVPFAHLPEQLARLKAEQGNSMQGGGGINFVCDLIGIVLEAQPMQEIMSKRQQLLYKRDLTLLDDSAAIVKLTIWGNDKQVDEVQLQPPIIVDKLGASKCNIIAVSQARLSDFAGCSLSTSFSSALFQNPPWSESRDLARWFATKGYQLLQQQQVAHLSTQRQGDSVAWVDQMALSVISDLQALKQKYAATMEPLTQALTFKVHARLTFIKMGDLEHPPWSDHKKMCRYPSCSSETCRGKKVLPSDGGTFYCEKCAVTTDSPKLRFLLNLTIQDETGSAWRILGHSADDMNQLRSSDSAAYASIFREALYKDFVFGVKAHDLSPRFQLSTVAPLDYAKDCSQMMDFLAAMDQQQGGADTMVM